ncbi:MAG: hypothetical protein PWQ85_1015 [Geotoga sp.]|nr:hypothetical protein [Geotoga sp.]
MIKSILKEYGLMWLIFRILYLLKLKIMKIFPIAEFLFEKKVEIKRMDIFDIDVEKIETFLKKLPDEKKSEIINIADKAIEGKILAFSSIELDYGNPIDWFYNPITNEKVSNSLKWYLIPDFDAKIGDIKVIWEASRFTHFYYFLRAYMITKNKKYYKAFSEHLKSWVENNKYSYGPNYKCGQEATLRMINSIIAFSVFKAYGLVKRIDEQNLHKLIEGSYKKVLSNFFYAHKCIKNNHTLSEITGMIVGAWCEENKKRLKKAYKLLDREIQSQFFSDGGYVQYSFNYQRFALQIIEFVLKISKKTGFDISEKSKKFIKNSVMLMYQMQEENGDLPNYGSNDGSLIFPVTSCDYRDFRPIINSLYAILENKRLYDPGIYDEEILWFGDKELNKIPILKKKRLSSAFKEAGLYSLRNDNSFLMITLQDFKSRPAHMDQLHIDVWYKGRNIFCDSGTFSYASELGNKLTLTEAHNTVVVDNKEQMKKYGPFLVYDWSISKKVQFDNISFKGTMISKNGYSHTRKIKMTKKGYLIEDFVKGYGKECKFYFHTPFEVRIVNDGFELLEKDKVIAKVKTTGNIEVKKAYRSLYYLKKDLIKKVSVSKPIINKQCNAKFVIELYD